MKTPYYIFNQKTILENYKKMQQNLNCCELHYSTKANGHIEILKVLSQIKNVGFEICSQYEWNILSELGAKADNILFGLPIKQESLIDELYKNGCRYFIFDTHSELEKLNRLAPNANKVLRILISDIIEECIPFGINIDNITREMMDQCDGLHFHITKNYDIIRQMLALDRIEFILERYSLRNIILNIGGSYNIDTKDSYYDLLNQRLSRMKKDYNLKIFAEPGEAIVHTAGRVYTTVLGIKEQKTHRDVYIDFGEPSGLRLIPDIVRLSNGERDGKRCLYRFFDNTCRHVARFSKFLTLDLRLNDCLELSPYGAYTLCLSNDFHNFPRPGVYIGD